MTKSNKTGSRRKLFKEMEILPFYSQYIFSLLMYVVNNKHLFIQNCGIHNHNTRNANNLHMPTANITKYKKETYYMGSRIYNQLPNYIKGLVNNEKIFKKTLQRFLIDNASLT